jgi:UDP-N-acetylglucosamine transferase subunit ALG13
VRVEPTKPLLFVTVGTDHHPFDRLVHWLDAWLESGAQKRVRCLLQHGASLPSSAARSCDFLGYDEMEGAFQEAAAVVCHGGPGTIMLAAEAGKVPIVVPRVRALGEHVDDHQVLFGRRLEHERRIVLAETESRFRLMVERALAAPLALPQGIPPSSAEAIRRFEEIVDELMAVPKVAR